MPTFPKGTGTLVGSIEALNILPSQVVDDTRFAVFVIRCDQQMLVITHQAIGMKLRAIACTAFTQKLLGMEIT